jgi:hypothetical protein
MEKVPGIFDLFGFVKELFEYTAQNSVEFKYQNE